MGLKRLVVVRDDDPRLQQRNEVGESVGTSVADPVVAANIAYIGDTLFWKLRSFPDQETLYCTNVACFHPDD